MKGYFFYTKKEIIFILGYFCFSKRIRIDFADSTRLFYALVCVYKKHMLLVATEVERSLELYLVKVHP